MILRHSIAVVSFCCALLLTQCKGDCHKHDTCDPIHYKLNIDIGFDYFIFKKNSYWIYKDTKTGAIDTQTCLGYDLDTVISKSDYEPSNNVSIEYPRHLHNFIHPITNGTYIKKRAHIMHTNPKRHLIG